MGRRQGFAKSSGELLQVCRGRHTQLDLGRRVVDHFFVKAEDRCADKVIVGRQAGVEAHREARNPAERSASTSGKAGESKNASSASRLAVAGSRSASAASE